MQEQEPTSIFDDKLSPKFQRSLLTISRWAKLIAVIGFSIGAFVVVIMLINGASIFEKFAEMTNLPAEGLYGAMIVTFFIFFFIVAAVLYFLYKASTLLQQGVEKNDTYLIAEGFVFLKRFFWISAIFSAFAIIGNILSLFNLS